MTSIKKVSSKTLAFAIVASLAGASSAVQAANTGNLTVTASVSATCDFVTSAAVIFGAAIPDQNKDAAGSVNWNCTETTTATVFMGPGSSGDVNARLMQGDTTAGTLGYQLYTDSGRTIPWTNATGVGITGTGYTPAGTGLPVYGRVLAAGFGSAIPDAYTDTVLVTITL
ncbi:MAG: spore coat U domain-containing protein [Gammaproteobacteria bacterium]|nr:spore coat U domain-containing protein [Gammaproteobacteria bacterium]